MEKRFEKLTKEQIIEIINKEGKEKTFNLSWSDLRGSDLKQKGLVSLWNRQDTKAGRWALSLYQGTSRPS
jgi:hypothetical protein